MYIVLVYDVSQEDHGTKRWSKIFKTCKRYLTHIQNSVFEGEISRAQLASLQQELSISIRSWILLFSSNHVRKNGWTRNSGAEKMT